MMSSVTEDFGRMIGCLWWKGICELLSRPPTRNIPSLSRKGFRRWSFPPTAVVRSFCSVRISFEKWMFCRSLSNLFSAEMSSSTVRDTARLCLCLHRRQRATTLVSFDHDEYFSNIVGSTGFATRQVDLCCSGTSPDGVGFHVGQCSSFCWSHSGPFFQMNGRRNSLGV